MERMMKKMYRIDLVAIIFSILMLWSVAIFVFTRSSSIFQISGSVLAVTMLIGAAAAVFATAALVAVWAHLRRNYGSLYREDLCQLNLLRGTPIGDEEADEEKDR
jgi:NADH:ubiquinone oxidoreductase subunit K